MVFFTNRSFYTEFFTHSKLVHAVSFYTQQVFTHRNFYTQQAFTQNLFRATAPEIAAPNPDFGAKSPKPKTRWAREPKSKTAQSKPFFPACREQHCELKPTTQFGRLSRLHPVEHPVSLPPSAVSPSYFHGFIPSSIRSRSLPAKFPQAISTASSRRASGLAPSQRSFPKLFPQAISTASSRRASGLAPSQRSFPKLFPRLHPVEHPVSLPPSAVFPSYFHGFIPSSIRSRSLPTQFSQAISPRYFHGFIPSSIRSRSLPAQFPQAISTASSRPSGLAPSQRSFPKLFSTLLSRPASGLAPSQRSFPKLFPRLHPVQHPVSLPPSEISSSYFHGFIPSSIRSRSLPAQFSQAISTASSRSASGLAPSLFPRLHHVQHPVSLPPSAVSPSYLHGFIPSGLALPPSEVSPSYFHGFIPSIRSRSLPAKFPQAIFHAFVPSSIRSRSLPAKFPQAISTASSRPASGLAPSQRNFLKLFPRLHPVQHPVSLPPSEVSPSYFPRFPVQHTVSLPPSEVSPSYFHDFIPSSIRSRSLPAKFPQAISTASSRPASGLAPSQRNFLKLFPRLHPVQHPVSLPPSEVSLSYFHGFIPSSIHSRSLPAKFPQAISTASSRPASGLAPSQRNFPKLFPRLHPVHPVSLPPSAVSPSDFHGFIPSSIRSRSLPAKFPQAISTASSRPASGLAPSQRSFPKL